MSRNKGVLILFSLLTLLILYFQALIPLWRGHLEIDIWDYYQTIEVFIKNGSFSNLKGNEILPGALLFLFFPLIFCQQSFNYGTYFKGIIFMNLILLVCHLFFYKTQSKSLNIFLFLLILLGLGPVLLFRFELVVSLFVLLSIYCWRENKNYLSRSISAFLLGVATTVKLYPLFFLPYYLVLNLSFPQKYKKNFITLVSFLGGIILPLLVFFLLGGSLEKTFFSLSFHAKKPISIESLPGSIFTAVSLFFNKQPPALFGGFGLWGIKPKFLDFNPMLLNFLSLSPLLIFYFYLFYKTFFLKKNPLKKLKASYFFITILLLLILSKNLHPQYLFWFISFFPLLKFKQKTQNDYLLLFGIIFVIAILTQYIYPLLYTPFIKNFYQKGQQIEIFYLQTLRNAFFLILLALSLKNILIKKTVE